MKIIKQRKVPETIYHKETGCPICEEGRADDEFKVHVEAQGQPLFHSENTKNQCGKNIIGYLEPEEIKNENN